MVYLNTERKNIIRKGNPPQAERKALGSVPKIFGMEKARLPKICIGAINPGRCVALGFFR